MRIISERQLFHDGKTRPAGEPFDAAERDARELIDRGVVRPYEAPQKVYETKPKQFERPQKRPRGEYEPLVTCVCPTTGRRHAWLEQAIRYFLLQTYAMKRLLLVTDETEGLDARDLPADPHIRLVVYHTAHRIPLGAKRNFACSQVEGEFIAHWDDDDYSAPGRLADQMPRLLESGKTGTCYHQMKFTDGRRWWKYTGSPINSSLLFRKSWWERHPFPEIQVASDIPFVNGMFDAGELVTVPSRDLMAASVHSGNTSPRSLSSSYQPIDPSEAVPGFVIPAEALAA